ncbi:MAG: hypothetical protein IKF00_13765 [Solobacterium sp.]|nr:hypothetical protein [Solobacterium sp.]
MAKYESYHFSPLNNRSMLMPKIKRGEPFIRGNRLVNTFEPIPEKRLIPEYPYCQINVGLTHKSIEVNGSVRSYAIYVPCDMRSKGACALIMPENGVTAEEFLKCENWKELSEKNKLAYIIFEAEKWNKEDVEKEFDFIQKVVDLEFSQRLTVDICESYIYPIGLGDGAYVASALGLTYSATYPAFAADGDCSVDPELFAVLRTLPADGIETMRKPEIAMPGFIIDRSGKAEATKAYMKETIRAKEEGLKNAYGEVYLETPRRGAYFVNEQPVSQVWLADESSVSGKSREELNEAMVSFVLRFSRWGGFGNNHLRTKRTLEETGVLRVEKEVEGLPRYWDVFVPSCYKPEEETTYPLVLAIHGFSCNSEYFEMTSDWQRLAEERGFFVVFASAYPRNVGRARFPVPGWSVWPMVMEGIDETVYFRELLDTTIRDYKIDTTRVYAVGHSNGGRMTQTLMRRMPERFAAFGPTGALAGSNIDALEPIDDSIDRPVYIMMGEYDIADAELKEGSAARGTVELYCQANHAEFNTENWYDNGNYHTLVLYNEKHIPIVNYTIMKHCPHTYTAEMAQMTWDLFLCHYRRNPDGTIEYKG